jgi:copper resistance protein B
MRTKMLWRLASLLACVVGLILANTSVSIAQVEDNQIFKQIIVDQFEYRPNEGQDALRWDVQGWIGLDYDKLWLKTEGERRISDGSSNGDAELQVLYSRAIHPFWDLQAGWRIDKLYGDTADPSRSFAVFGVQGLAPYWFETEAAVYISEDSDVSARLTASYELLFTQRLILQPRLEINAAASSVPEFGVGKGINDLGLGARLRYEVRREVAPYIGVEWTKKLGETADLAKQDGEDSSLFTIVSGVRLYF